MDIKRKSFLEQRSKEELIDYIEDISNNWLAIDGTWFLAVEEEYDIEKAIELDKKSWERFTVIEARRIMKRFNIPPNGGIEALMKALKHRVYANINVQELIEVSENHCVFRMNDCRVQSARKRKELPDFPCKSVGIVEYSGFAKTIDSRITTTCVCCPPDPHSEDYYCAWEFRIKDS